jgi:hypothetical protein
MPDTRTEHTPINLLLADVRQALFDEAKSDQGAGAGLRYEAGRAVGLMGRAMDEISAAQSALPTALEEQKYLVWSNEHKAWWGKDRCGYTRIIANAGRYDRDEALNIAGTRDGGWRLNKGNPDEIAIPEQDAIDQYAEITRAQQSGDPA